MSSISPAIAERAVEWMVELQAAPHCAATRALWQQWRDGDAEHERAWQRIEAFGERFAGAVQHAHIAHATLTAAQGVAHPQRRRALKVLAVLVAGGSAGWAGRDTALWQNLSADYSTAVGEQRRLALADGSGVLLNTDSAIDVAFDDTARRLRLLRGEVQVEVAAQSRPFFASTAQGQMETSNCTFQLRQVVGASCVAVSQGRLSLRVAQLPALEITAGQRVLFTQAEVGPARVLSEADRAWADGIIIANDQPLADFLAELSRYRPGHLSCAASLAQLRVAGTYPLADTERILQTLGATLGLNVRRFTRYWVTLEPKNRRA
jgi:transmembrane sensor